MNPLRNIAIIAHVDHGKTTLVDKMLLQAGTFRENQQVQECVMDSNDLERERGITILAKNCSITYRGVKINIIDTPGHADFGGEVERVLKMADGCLLLVDAAEGPMPQTRFVLRKALEHRLRPVVVVNKIDRQDARPAEVLDEVLDLFISLGADEHQIEFPVVYCIGRQGVCRREPEGPLTDLQPLFEAILGTVPAPANDPALPLQLQVASIDYNEFVGRIGIGRVHAGVVREGQDVAVCRLDGSVVKRRVTALFTFTGLGRERIPSVSAGDIAAVAGIEDVDIGETIADPDSPEPLDPITVEEPTIRMIFGVNGGPFAGREGKYVTSRHLRDRLTRETLSNVALRVEDTRDPSEYAVSGRGILHLGVLVETMRREGYEFVVGKPVPIFREEDGKRLEPLERVVVDAPEESSGKVVEILGRRRGDLLKMDRRGDRMHMEFLVPSRGMLGVRTRILNATRGEGVMHANFETYGEYRGGIPGRTEGVQVSMAQGRATGYAIQELKDRGPTFCRPGDEVYPGQVVGEHCKEGDIIVNLTRTKKLTNIRSAGAERLETLTPPRTFTVEEALEYIETDELVEVTPASVRLRKRLLDEKDRKRQRVAAEE
ncbi:MAG: translational GTPase TypA [Planctomycetaceae bacterium]|nr:translational GTPase TypA [Planctomycetota bacterium]NUN51401.1 translational GTPase TypA [Planctomycetaceae bacterium]